MMMMMTITKKEVQVENSGALKNHDCYMRLQDKTSQPLLNAWSRVVSENWNEHLKNCIVVTCKAFLHCE